MPISNKMMMTENRLRLTELFGRLLVSVVRRYASKYGVYSN